MSKVRVTVPAACTNLGPGIDSLGLAITLHNIVEINPRSDGQKTISVSGASRDYYPAGQEHPALVAATMLCEKVDRTAGFDLVCTGEIPAGFGLGSLYAWTVGGLVAANNLFGVAFRRETIAEIGSMLTGRPVGIVTSLLGSLTMSSGIDGDLVYRRLDIASFQIVVICPDLPDYREKSSQIALNPVEIKDLAFIIGRATLVVEAMRKPDYDLLSKVIPDRILEPQRASLIPGYDTVRQVAHQEGAVAVCLSGGGPALIAFAPKNHAKINQAMQRAFADMGVKSRGWVLNVDTQGVAISMTR